MDIFMALAEPTRRNIVELLAMKGELSASDISDKFKVSSSAISQHLKVLREAEIVKMEKKAQMRIYAINPAAISQLEEWTKKLKDHWEGKFKNLEKLLAGEVNKNGR
ncbi:winged helix-turn-helix transcriptional regulator [Candidatus Curtissbacteria bacterium]|nr:winged helix-turn-helix transcriptional regulator [Candidatus Curtissbacteria bacterium]